VTQPHSSRARPLTQDLLLSSARRTPRFFYFPNGKSAPNRLSSHDPLSSLIGGSELAISQVHCLSLGSPIPETRWLVNTDFIFPCRDLCFVRIFLIGISLLTISSTMVCRLPIPDATKLRCTRELSLQLLVTSIGNSEFAGSRILMSMDSGLTFS
jgi:hypothetical protein